MAINIGITGTGSLVGQAVIKCIIRSEYSNDFVLHGFDYFENTVGSFWCTNNFILPDLLKPNEEENWLKELELRIKENDIKILFVGVDFELPVLAHYKDRIKGNTGCIVIVSNEEVIRIGNDKYLTYEFLLKNGLHFPQTFLPEEIQPNVVTYPIIVKPRVGARSVGVYKVKNEAELKQALESVKEPIIQELVGNDDTEYTCGIIAFDGVVKQSIALRRSLKDGNTFISEFKEDFPSVIYDYIKAISEHLKPFGVCNFQLRLDKQGIPKLFEINPRHSGTTYMRSLFGYNEVIFILKYLIEGVEISFELLEGTVIRHFEETKVEKK